MNAARPSLKLGGGSGASNDGAPRRPRAGGARARVRAARSVRRRGSGASGRARARAPRAGPRAGGARASRGGASGAVDASGAPASADCVRRLESRPLALELNAECGELLLDRACARGRVRRAAPARRLRARARRPPPWCGPRASASRAASSCSRSAIRALWAASSRRAPSSSRSRASSACARSSAARSRRRSPRCCRLRSSPAWVAFRSPSRRSSSASSRSRAAIASARSRSDCFSRSSSELACAWLGVPFLRELAGEPEQLRPVEVDVRFRRGASPRRRGVHESKLSSQRSIRLLPLGSWHHGARFRRASSARSSPREGPAGSCAGRISRKQAPCGYASS